MKNISITQCFIVVLIGVLLFSDFSKTLKTLQKFIKNSKIYKTLKKK